jgi:hypothetical protein
VSDARTADDLPENRFAQVFIALSLAAGLISFFYRPFAFAPVGLLALVIAVLIAPRYQTLYRLCAVVVVLGFVVGAAIAVATENPLY